MTRLTVRQRKARREALHAWLILVPALLAAPFLGYFLGCSFAGPLFC